MALILRDYQHELIHDIRTQLRKHNSVLAVAPTGTGKTATASEMLGNVVKKNKRAFFIVHRQELIEQSSIAFAKADIPHGFVCAGEPINPFVPIHICSIDTLKNRMERLANPDLMVFDEAHHTAAAGWRRVFDSYPDAKKVGLTATPCRLDGQGLGEIFNSMVKSKSVRWFIENGYLSPYKLFSVPLDITGVKTKFGDFVKKDIEELMDNQTIVGNAIQHYRELAYNKQGVAFCVSIAHSKHVADQFNAAGYTAAHIDGEMKKDERARIIDDFRQGKIRILTNVDLVGEGFDLPALEVSILLRPTKSLSLYLQQVGRALRPFPGKTHAVIIDHAGNYHRHGAPDEERNWQLGMTKTAQQSSEGKIPTRVCAKCYHVHRPQPTCPACGLVYEAEGRILKEIDGKLIEITPQDIIKTTDFRDHPARTIDALIEMGKQRKEKNPIAWAAKMYSSGAK